MISYFVLFIGGKHYLKEYFQVGGDGSQAGAGSPTASSLYPAPPPVEAPVQASSGGSGRVIMEYTTPDTVAKNNIQSLGDYEYNYVFQNENDREISQALRNKLMSQRPMDWAGLPPSSAQFEAGVRESFENANQTTTPSTGSIADGVDPYANINGDSMVPPDTLSVEMEERKVLQTYKAPTAQQLDSYNPDEEKSPEQMIHDIYDKKGLVPTVAHKDGTNVYEVIGVRRKDEKIVYEDEEAPASYAPVMKAGEATISVPPTAYDVAAARDPYYNTAAPGGAPGTRMDRWNYQKWTPGLERMFAPTEAQENWY